MTGTLTAPAARTDSRPTTPGATRARIAYGWNNSENRLARWARGRWDSRASTTSTVMSTSDGGASIAYAGLPIGRVNLLQLLERQREAIAGPTSDHRLGRTTWRRLRAGDWPDADLVVVGADRRHIDRLPTCRALVAPFRVHLVVPLDDGLEAVRRRISKRERWEFRRNRKEHGWELEEDSSEAALSDFYHHMHVPTMQARHGERGRTESLDVAREAILRRGCLLLVRAHGRRVCGVLCQVGGGTLTTRLLGVRDGADEHYENGSFKAIYHLLLEWAVAHGLSHVDFFGTEAFLSKGIFQWKRKFAPHVVLPPNHFSDKRMYLHVRRDTPAVRDLLVANPLLAVTARGLSPVYFADAERAPRLDISCRCPGLPAPIVLDMDEFLAGDSGMPDVR